MKREIVHAGELERRITIEQYTTTRDLMGEEVKTWVVWRTNIPAQKIHQDTKKEEEDYRKNILVAEGVIQWRIRNIGTPTTLMRIIDEYNNIYDIMRIDELGRRAGWMLKSKIKE